VSLRLPHANSSANRTGVAREVIYASFLPDVAINRRYALHQLGRYRRGLIPTDQWLRPKSEKEEEPPYAFSELGRRLMGEGLGEGVDGEGGVGDPGEDDGGVNWELKVEGS
jgi:hypothetical protein